MSAIMISSGTSSPRVVDRLDPAAELGAVGHRRAEHVAGRDVRDAVLGGDELALGSLAGSLRAKQEDVERHRYFRKPS
jgi:hypothetical protein